jgi:hypothetical protein
LNLCRQIICVSWLKPPNTNNYLNMYKVVKLLVSAVLGQSIPIMIFGIQQSIPKKPSFFISFKWYWPGGLIPKMAYQLTPKMFSVVVKSDQLGMVN